MAREKGVKVVATALYGTLNDLLGTSSFQDSGRLSRFCLRTTHSRSEREAPGQLGSSPEAGTGRTREKYEETAIECSRNRP